MSSDITFLKVSNIHKSFGGVQALKNVDLDIRQGEIHCLAGENGCGKSTLIKIISGEYVADSGCIQIEGKSYKKLTPMEAIDLGIQVIYQDFSLFPNLTVMENITLAQTLKDHKKLINWKDWRRLARESVSKINFQADLDQKVETLPVASKQLVAISRALLFNAKLIIMDEPTTALTKKEVKALFKIIHELKDRGISILFVSHKIEEIYEICDRLTVFRNGEHIITGDLASIDRNKFTYYMTGRNIFESQYTCPAPGKVLIEVDHLTLPGAYENVSFHVRQGEILGITGLLGSGRTELALSLFGILRAREGTIKMNDELIEIHSISSAIRYGIGYVPEDRITEALFLPQSIEKNLIVSILDTYTKHRCVMSADLRKIAESWTQRLKIKLGSLQNPVSSLSGGNQQKVVLSKWLASDLKFLILNGPTVGVDIGAKFDIHQILRDLAATGMAILLITDDLAEVLANCNRIMVMQEGRIVTELNASETSESQLSDMISSEKTSERSQHIVSLSE